MSNSRLFIATLAFLPLGILSAPPAIRAQELPIEVYTVQGTAGYQIRTPLVEASDGNFYTVTPGNGTSLEGSIVRLSPAGVATVAYSFTALAADGTNTDGAHPNGLVAGHDGNLYGLTGAGGANGQGTFFQYVPGGALNTRASLNFVPSGVPVEDSKGDFFYLGSLSDGGAIYEVTAAGAMNLFHAFTPTATDGTNPEGYDPETNLVIDGSDNLYGFAASGGSYGYGTFYEVTPGGKAAAIYSYNYAPGYSGGAGDTTPRPSGSRGPAGIVATSDGAVCGIASDGIFKAAPGEAPATLYTFSATTYDGSTALYYNDDGAFPNGLTLGANGNLYGSTGGGGADGEGTVFEVTPSGDFGVLYTFPSGSYTSTPPVLGKNGNLYGTSFGGTGPYYGLGNTLPSAFFTGQVGLGNGVDYLQFLSGTPFGYYSYLSDPNYIYHFDLGYEYVFDANDGKKGVYFYDFASSDFFYTSPTFPFPYLYDFSLNTVLYYYPDPNNAGHYNTNGVRYFYDFATGKIISK